MNILYPSQEWSSAMYNKTRINQDSSAFRSIHSFSTIRWNQCGSLVLCWLHFSSVTFWTVVFYITIVHINHYSNIQPIIFTSVGHTYLKRAKIHLISREVKGFNHQLHYIIGLCWLFLVKTFVVEFQGPSIKNLAYIIKIYRTFGSCRLNTDIIWWDDSTPVWAHGRQIYIHNRFCLVPARNIATPWN